MPYFIVTTLINTVICSFCCLFVLVLNYKSRTVKSFALFNCAVAIWSFFYFLSMLATRHDEALAYSRVLNTVALFIAPAFLQFCINITGNKSTWIKRTLSLFTLLDILIIPLVPTPLFIKRMHAVSVFPFWPDPGPLFLLSMIEYATLIPIALYLLHKELRSSQGDIRKQFGILFYSFLIAFAGGGTNFFPCLGIPIAPYGNALVSFFMFGFVFLIFKYQIMDLKIALSRSFAYTIVIFLLTVFYFTTTYVTEFFVKEWIGYKSFVFSFLYAAVSAAAFVPLRNWLQRLTDRIFFRKTIEEIEEENKLLIKEVAQTDHLKSVSILASGMAHEIKNPLTALKTFSEYLPHRMDDRQFLTKFAPIVLSEVNRIDALVHDLLDFAKPAPLHIKRTDIHAVLNNTLDVLSSEFLRGKIRIIKDYAENQALNLNLDINQIKQALLNVFLNAIQAMPHGGTLTVSTILAPDVQKAWVRVQDSGCGIDAADLPHIFDPFFSKKDNGTGLGLSITAEIVKNHNGTVRAESRAGTGTTIIIELPYAF